MKNLPTEAITGQLSKPDFLVDQLRRTVQKLGGFDAGDVLNFGGRA